MKIKTDGSGETGGLEARGPGSHVGWHNRGYLPHFDSHGIVQHIIFRLADALPGPTIAEFDNFPVARRLEKINEALDSGCGGRLLENPKVAESVERTLLHFDGERYHLLACCVMPTHVHALVEQIQGYPLSQVVHSWKSFSANAANRKLRRNGAFWAPEYFDRFMRDGDQFEATRMYVERSPVEAGLCTCANEWRFSSAWKGR